MKSTLEKLGNDLAIRISKELAEELNLKPGSAINMSIDDDTLVIAPIKKKPAKKKTLKEIVTAITFDDRHPERNWGKKAP